MKQPLKIIISGGGTGGHIFPALSIANAVREKQPDADILFVGAENRMEMQRVPAAGYPIKGLPVYGFDRKHLWRNIHVIIQLLKSQRLAHKIIRDFAPQVAVGVGGYASGPTLKEAGKMGIPTLLQEQNSYAGVTNKLLAKKARLICVAYEGMERFFPKERIIITGNPVRQSLIEDKTTREEALQLFQLDGSKKTVLIVGGSLGARSMNRCVLENLEVIKSATSTQFIWQTGKFYTDMINERLSKEGKPDNLHVTEFITNMAAAYKAADLVVSRAGAGSISEFCLLGKAVILVPSPNVAEDHQTKNAMALVNKKAAIHIKDVEVNGKLIQCAIATVNNPQVLSSLSKNILELALPHSASTIADKVIALAEEFQKQKEDGNRKH